MKFTDPDLIKDFYDQFGSQHFKLQSTTLERFGTQKLDIYFKSLGFVIQVISIVGVIAGFGFTAFEYIQSKPLFILGEAILLGTIIYGVVWIQRIYKSEFSALVATTNKLNSLFQNRNKKFEKIWNDIIQRQEADDSEIKELVVVGGQELIDAFKSEDKKESLQIYPRLLYLLLVVGSIFLLLSFILGDLINMVGLNNMHESHYINCLVTNEIIQPGYDHPRF